MSGRISINWTNLPDDAVGIIAEHLTIVDYIRFHSVCRAWNHAVISGRYLPRLPQTPWLMLAGDHDKVGFLDIGNRVIYKKRLEDTEVRNWKVTDNHIVAWNNNPLCNPRSDGQQQEELYSFPIIPAMPVKSLKLFVNAPTATATIIVLKEDYMVLYFARADNTFWTKVIRRLFRGFQDTCYYEGDIYTVGDEEQLLRWGFSDYELISNTGWWSVGNSNIHRRVGYQNNKFFVWYKYNKFFVPSAARLLLVFSLKSRYDDDFDYYNLYKNAVFELDKQTDKWNQIWSLGGDAIFVGSSTAMLVDAASLPKNGGFHDRIIVTRTAPYPHYSHNAVMLYDVINDRYDTDNIYTWPKQEFDRTFDWFMPKPNLHLNKHH